MNNALRNGRSLRLALGMVALVGLVGGASGQTTVRASLADNGAQADGASLQNNINSATGQWVVFSSNASNLVPAFGVTSNTQVYMRNVLSGNTVLVSKNALGFEANGACYNPSISASGQYVVFTSEATNLDAGDGLVNREVYRCDTSDGSIVRISVADDGAEGNDVSMSGVPDATGNLVIFRSFATNMVAGGTAYSQMFLRNVSEGTTTLVSVSSTGASGNSDSGGFNPTFTPDGRYVGFSTKAGNLIASGLDTNGNWDVYRRDLQTGTNTRVSLPTSGVQYNGMSHSSAISDNGQFVAFASVNAFNITDTNGTYDVFLKNLATGALTRISNTTKGKFANGASGNDATENRGISMNGAGTRIAFVSNASDLVSGDGNGVMDVFVWNSSTNKSTRVSLSTSNGSANGPSSIPQISNNGYISFASTATNLVTGDTNGVSDVFRRGTY